MGLEGPGGIQFLILLIRFKPLDTFYLVGECFGFGSCLSGPVKLLILVPHYIDRVTFAYLPELPYQLNELHY